MHHPLDRVWPGGSWKRAFLYRAEKHQEVAESLRRRRTIDASQREVPQLLLRAEHPRGKVRAVVDVPGRSHATDAEAPLHPLQRDEQRRNRMRVMMAVQV